MSEALDMEFRELPVPLQMETAADKGGRENKIGLRQ